MKDYRDNALTGVERDSKVHQNFPSTPKWYLIKFKFIESSFQHEMLTYTTSFQNFVL